MRQAKESEMRLQQRELEEWKGSLEMSDTGSEYASKSFKAVRVLFEFGD